MVSKLPSVILFDGLVLVLGHIVPFPASAISGIPKAEQDQCYGQTPIGQDNVTRLGTCQDGEKRSGVTWPHIRFPLTYHDSTGPWADQSADCDANVSTDMITNNLTGLMWTNNVYSPGSEYVIPRTGKTDHEFYDQQGIKLIV